MGGLYMYNNKIYNDFSIGLQNSFNPTILNIGITTLKANTWNNIIMTIPYNGYVNIYINGVLDSVSGTKTPSFGLFTMKGFFATYTAYGFNIGGARTQVGPNLFRGSISDFRMYNRIITNNEIQTIVNNNGIYQNPLTTNLITNYKFEGNLLDSAGTNHLTTGVNINYMPGIVNNSSLYLQNEYSVQTSTKSVSFASNESFNLSASNFTVSTWIYPTGAASGAARIWELATNTIGRVGLYLPTNSLKLYTGTNFGSNVSGPQLTSNMWYNITSVINTTDLSLYVNGKFIGINTFTVPFTYGATINRITFGDATAQGLPRPFAGYIDDFRLYNRALSPAEINGVYYSSANNSYVLYQQTIDGNNVSDLAWGTQNAQSLVVSAWIKNISTTPQSYNK